MKQKQGKRRRQGAWLSRALRSVLRRCRRFIWDENAVVVFAGPAPADRWRLPGGHPVQVRELLPAELSALGRGFGVPGRVLASRAAQGCRAFGAFWNGCLTDYCWMTSGPAYRDLRDRLTVHLREDERFLFDYMSAPRGRPASFGGLRLMKALAIHVMKTAEREAARRLLFYTFVDADNRVSIYFHERCAHGRRIGSFRMRRLLGRRWTPRRDCAAIPVLRGPSRTEPGFTAAAKA